MKFTAALCAVLILPVYSLVFKSGNFKTEFSGQIGDTLHVDTSLGTTVTISPSNYISSRVLSAGLSEGAGTQTQAVANPRVSYTGSQKFKVGYLGWRSAPTSQTIPYKPAPADIRIRSITFANDSATMDANGSLIAALENITDTTGKFYGGFPDDKPPPSYFHFEARNPGYAAYWGTLKINGSIRRTSHLDSIGQTSIRWGKYVPRASPAISKGFGTLGMGIQPGSNSVKTVLAYEVEVNPAAAEIRWEDIDAGTSVSNAIFSNSPMSEFAVGVDSLGSSLIVWRQNDSVYMAGFDANKVQVQATTLLFTGLFFFDGVTNRYYAPYSIRALVNGSFLLTYGRGSTIYYRNIQLPINSNTFSPGTETTLTAGGKVCRWPNLDVNNRYVIFTYFVHQGGGIHRLEALRYDRNGNSFTTVNPFSADIGGENIAFDQVGTGWYPWHYFRSPSVAVDEKGNFVASYDNQFNGKLVAYANVPYYYDSAVYISSPAALENSSLSFSIHGSIDSVEFSKLSINADSGVTVSLSSSATNDFSASSFQTPDAAGAFPSVFRTNATYIKYRAVLKTNSPLRRYRPALRSVTVDYNVKPRTPFLDSIKLGSGAWQVYDSSQTYILQSRRDSLYFVFSTLDHDNKSRLRFTVSSPTIPDYNDSIPQRPSAGMYRSRFAFGIRSNVGQQQFSIYATDSSGWSSERVNFSVLYVNTAPNASFQVFREKGRDLAGIYVSTGGGLETLSAVQGDTITAHYQDSLRLQTTFNDVNDDSLAYSFYRNGKLEQQGRRPRTATFALSIQMDAATPLIDSLALILSDPDTSLLIYFFTKPNRPPRIDSIWLASYYGTDSIEKTGVFDRIKDFSSDTGINVPPKVFSRLVINNSDSDSPIGDSISTRWEVFSPKITCANLDLSCFLKSDSVQSDTLARIFGIDEAYFRIRVTDRFGAFLQDTIKLEFPALDSSRNTLISMTKAIEVLRDSIRFVLDSPIRSKSVQAEIMNAGTVALQIPVIKTLKHDDAWMNYTIQWTQNNSFSNLISVRKNTESSPILFTKPILLEPGQVLRLQFSFFTDSLSGDAFFTDTLELQSNDFFLPLLKIPFSVSFDDLPTLGISLWPAPIVSTQNSATGRLIANNQGLPSILPRQSGFRFVFSEPVRADSVLTNIHVYSKVDSLALEIKGSFSVEKDAKIPSEFPDYFLLYFHRNTENQVSSTLIDSAFFRPKYEKAPAGFNYYPSAGEFLAGDKIVIRVGNGIVDSVGNALDIRRNRIALSAQSFDSTFTLTVDSSTFRVTRSYPVNHELNAKSDEAIQIHFNHRLSQFLALGTDTLKTLDLDSLAAGKNRSLRVSSAFNAWQPYELKYVRLGPGDSSLIFQTRPKFSANDSVSVILYGRLSDTLGLSLDGNRDGIPSFRYDTNSREDDFIFDFRISNAPFYVFPNPYRFDNIRHREKGGVTFKNLSSLKGFALNTKILFRFYDMAADLVYDSEKSGQSPIFGQVSSGSQALAPEWNWNLQNSFGRVVASGVYIYQVVREDGRVLTKGKLAVIH